MSPSANLKIFLALVLVSLTFIAFFAIELDMTGVWRIQNLQKKFSSNTFRDQISSGQGDGRAQYFSDGAKPFLNHRDDISNLEKLISTQSTGKLASTGNSFTGDRIRVFGNDRRKFDFFKPEKTLKEKTTYEENQRAYPRSERSCTKWAVVTTIHEPSESVRRMLYLINRPNSGWCMVIVGDLELPSSYEFVSTLANHVNVVFLNSDEQKKISYDKALRSTFGPAFVDSIPWHSFGRKNVGFAYAITQKPMPSFIWDFDDDNQLKFWMDHANLQSLHSLDNLIDLLSNSGYIEAISVNTSTYGHSTKYSKTSLNGESKNMESESEPDVAFNPYPALGCQLSKCWPRGFPPSQVEQINFYGQHQSLDSSFLSVPKVKPDSISIIQSVADHKPDVDAVFRLTVNNQPFSFEHKNDSAKKIDKLLIIPKGLVVPMNAQATLHARSAFFGLYLPWTVNGRVSDIWRSYIAQAILSLTDHTVAFAPLPLVDQDRNTDHGPMSDFDAEIQLYIQIDALIKRLYEWKLKQYNNFRSAGLHNIKPAEYFTQNLAALIEDLYIELYERHFVEEGDVLSVQYWIQLLTCYGYIYSYKAEKCQNLSWNVGLQPVLSQDKLNKFTQLGNPDDDYTVSTCPDYISTSSKLTFLNVDLHDGSRLDIPALVASLGHKTILAGHKGRKTPYPMAHRRNYSSSKTKMIEFSRTRSKLVRVYRKHSRPLKDPEIDENFKFYNEEGKTLIDQVDAFTSSFPPAMYQMWNWFLFPEKQARSRSVIIAAAHRYNIGRCSVRQWRQLNNQIKSLLSFSSHQHAAGGMSRYDLEYMYHYTGIPKAANGYMSNKNSVNVDQSRHISLTFLPAMPAFYTRPELRTNSMKKVNTLITFIRGHGDFFQALKQRFESAKERNIFVSDAKKLYRRYKLSDLTQHGAILYFPYSVMSYKFAEFYSLSIPLMVPSLKFFRDQDTFGHDRTSTSRAYCRNEKLGLNMPKASNSVHNYNPNIMANSKLGNIGNETTNNINKQHELYWLQFSDFYDWPHIIYFDNATHAADLFIDLAGNSEGEELLKVKKLMDEENKMRRYFAIIKTWCPLLDDIHRSIHVAN